MEVMLLPRIWFRNRTLTLVETLYVAFTNNARPRNHGTYRVLWIRIPSGLYLLIFEQGLVS